MKKMKKWQIVLIVILAIGVIGALGGSGKDGDKKDDGSKTADTKKEEQKEEPKETIYKVGDTVSVGDVEYVVNSMEVKDTVGDEYLNTKAQNMFLVVNVSIKNNGNKELSVSDSFFKLIKGDKEFGADSGSAIYLGDESIIFKNINPEASLTGTIIFDVAQDTIDSPELQLQVQTGVFGTEKGLITLH